MNASLEWIKSNVASVIFIVVMIAALVTLPLVARGLNGRIGEDMEARAAELTKMEKLEKTSVTVGSAAGGAAESYTVVVNEKLLERLREVSTEQRADAEAVRKAATEHNRKGRGVLLPSLFPEPPPAEREVLPERFHRLLQQAYEDLLVRMNAGSPPSAESLRAEIEQRKVLFLTQILQKGDNDALDEDEAAQLADVLTQQRLSRYAKEAERIGLYATLEALNAPAWDQQHQPSMADLYDWQWQYWIVEDIVEALAGANRDKGSVVLAPVKRLLEVYVYADDSLENAGGSAGGGGGPGFGAPAGRSRKKATAPPPANPDVEVKLNFGYSFTGRVTNPLYDVRQAEVRLVVGTAQLPEVMDALAQRNFITILDVHVTPLDPYEAIHEGYFYGSEPVSEVTLRLETVWLRNWTSPFMPPAVRAALGVPDPAPAKSG